MAVMKALASCTATLLALLLVTQGVWSMPGCDTRAAQSAAADAHTGMPGMPMDHQQQPTSPHHGSCELALCAMMTSCGPTALVTHAPRLAPTLEATQGKSTWIATSNPIGPTAPEPPPPRA